MTTILSLKTIRATLSLPGAPGKQSGIGRIEVSDSGSFLKTGSERVPVNLPETASLHDGQRVRYEVSGNSVQITPVGEESRQSSGGPAEILSLSLHENAPVSGSVSPVPASFPVSSMEPGIHLFTSVEEVLALTGTIENEQVLEELKARLTTDGVIALRVATTANNSMIAVPWPLEDLPVALHQLTASFSSRLLSSIPPELLIQVLFDRGSLPFDPLSNLDIILRSTDTAFPDFRAGSPEAQEQAILQWLHSALTIDLSGTGEHSLAPTVSAGTMMNDLEPVFEILMRQDIPTLFPAERFSFPDLKSSLQNLPSLLPETAERIGYTFEHQLVSPGVSTMETARQDTLKFLLLNLAATFFSANDVNGTPDIPNKPPPTTTQPGNRSGTTAAVFERLKTALQAVLGHSSSATPRSAPGPDFNFPVPPPTISAPQQTIPVDIQPSSTQPSLYSSLDAVIGLLDTYLDRIDRSSIVASPSTLVETTITKQLRTILHELSALLSTEESPTSVGNPDSAAATVRSVSSLPDTVLILVRNALEIIEDMFTEKHPILTTESDAAHGREAAMDRERAAMPKTAAESPQTPQSDQSTPSLIRALGTALDRLESLQLLARQVATTQGTQQIIALPIKFGDTWTEINVRFLHQKKKKSPRNRSGQVTVAVDVAPPALGAIHAHLRYHSSKELQMSIEFENRTTERWFGSRHEEIRTALLQTGMKAVHLELHHARRANRHPDGDPTGSGDTLIDMKV
ncbi:MAG: hypothetical protein JW863_09725 [Chitinispirillaceae bacterium]|nr:hypothetical protein [Chitinispirillaceae bacterium]